MLATRKRSPPCARELQGQSLNMLGHGLDYIKNCFVQDPTNYDLVHGDVYVYQIGDVKVEKQLWRRPEDITVCTLWPCACAPLQKPCILLPLRVRTLPMWTPHCPPRSNIPCGHPPSPSRSLHAIRPPTGTSSGCVAAPRSPLPMTT
jgi:hypothetical protein